MKIDDDDDGGGDGDGDDDGGGDDGGGNDDGGDDDGSACDGKWEREDEEEAKGRVRRKEGRRRAALRIQNEDPTHRRVGNYNLGCSSSPNP